MAEFSRRSGTSVATIKRTLAIVDHTDDDAVPDHLGVALRALSPVLDIPDDQAADYERATRRVDGLLHDLGRSTVPDAPGRADLIRALVAIDRRFPGGVSDEGLRHYADVARRLAEFEIPDDWDPSGPSADALRYAVLGTVLSEPLILALRRLAHMDRHQRLGDAGGSGAD